MHLFKFIGKNISLSTLVIPSSRLQQHINHYHNLNACHEDYAGAQQIFEEAIIAAFRLWEMILVPQL